MTKKERVYSVLKGKASDGYVPAAFFLHFDPEYHTGQAAVDKHMEFFRKTDMDFVKIQFELDLPADPSVARPEDWSRVPVYGQDYYKPALQVVRGLVDAADGQAPVLPTLYSPFQCAGQITGRDTLVAHLKQDPDAVKVGLEKVTESLLGFVRGCIDCGVDGFYASSQGAEVGFFEEPAVFADCIKPADLAVWDRIKSCAFNILHVCDYHGRYAGLEQHLDYPGHVVNCGLELTSSALTPIDVASLFGRPFMGGLDRHGVLATGTPETVRATTREVLAAAPDRFILGADCTVPKDTNWENLKAAIETAHAGR